MGNPADVVRGRIYSRVLKRCVPIRVNRGNIRRQNAAKNLAQAGKLLGHREEIYARREDGPAVGGVFPAQVRPL